MNEKMEPRAPSPLLERVMRACRRALAGVGAFSFVINALMLTIPIYMIQVFDRVMTSRSEDTLWVLSAAALGAFAIMGLIDLVRSRLLVRIGGWLDSELARPLFAAAMASPGGRGGETSPGQVLRDLAQVRGFLTGPSVFPLLDAPWFPVFVGFIFLMHPLLGAIALVGAALLLGLAIVNDRATRKPLAMANAVQAENMAALEAMGRQREAIIALGMTPALASAWAKRGESVAASQALASDRAGSFMALSRCIRLSLQIIILAVAAVFVIHDQLTAGAMMATSIMFGRALAPVEQAVGVWRQLIDARFSFRRLRSTLEVAETGDAVSIMPLPRPTGALVIEAVTCIPPGAREPLFRGLSLALAPGEMLGVIGPSGAGKSTLARLLVGLAAPQGGAVRLDGMDVHTWAAADLGPYIGYVPQVVELIPGTIHANIARFTEASPQAVIAAASAAGIHDLVLKLPLGYDTPVGGPHDILSAGTRQRVALARALFADPALLILDEPYSNLDTAGLRALMAALAAAKARGVTIVIIAHRPSVIAPADKVLLIEGGGAKLMDRAARAKLSVVEGNAATAANLRPALTDAAAALAQGAAR